MEPIGKVRLTQRPQLEQERRPKCDFCGENEAACSLTLRAAASAAIRTNKRGQEVIPAADDLACDECCDHTGGQCVALPRGRALYDRTKVIAAELIENARGTQSIEKPPREQAIAAAVALLDHVTEECGTDAVHVQAVAFIFGVLGATYGEKASTEAGYRAASERRVAPEAIAELCATVLAQREVSRGS